MVKLTKAQRRGLIAAERSGGVVGFGPSAQTILFLRDRGFLSLRKDRAGYFTITDAGRAALRGHE